jgi:hypothetical protein
MMFNRRKRHERRYEDMPEFSTLPRIQKLVSQHFNTNREEEDITDVEGLRRAYNDPNRLYKHGDKLYIAGTTWTDDKMDITKPNWYKYFLTNSLITFH